MNAHTHIITAVLIGLVLADFVFVATAPTVALVPLALGTIILLTNYYHAWELTHKRGA